MAAGLKLPTAFLDFSSARRHEVDLRSKSHYFQIFRIFCFLIRRLLVVAQLELTLQLAWTSMGWLETLLEAPTTIIWRIRLARLVSSSGEFLDSRQPKVRHFPNRSILLRSLLRNGQSHQNRTLTHAFAFYALEHYTSTTIDYHSLGPQLSFEHWDLHKWHLLTLRESEEPPPHKGA